VADSRLVHFVDLHLLFHGTVKRVGTTTTSSEIVFSSETLCTRVEMFFMSTEKVKMCPAVRYGHVSTTAGFLELTVTLFSERGRDLMVCRRNERIVV